MATAEIFVLGVGHREAGVEIRERLQGSGAFTTDALFRFQTAGVLDEALLISTCNRLEVVGTSRDAASARERIEERMCFFSGLEPEELQPCVHFYTGEDAVEYLFRVAAGLDSRVVGEAQILGQVKEAFREAMLFRTVGPMINRLFHKSFQTAKRIRSETGVASGRVSVASAAIASSLEALAAAGVSVADVNALVVGAGEMASLLASHLKTQGVKSLTVLSRSLGRAQALASRFGAQVRTLPQLGEALLESDVVFTAAGGGARVLLKDEIAPIHARRGGKPWWIFDLGVPRNAEGAVGELENVTLMNVDAFSAEAELSLERRRSEALRADVIIREEVSKFKEWASALATRPTIKDLTFQAEKARRVELQRTISRNDFTEKEIQSLDAMTRALVRRLLHHPLMFTKSCHRHWKAEFNLGMVRRIFGLD
ncbi:MAG: glutamyl-tRNA reductase [Deltaproteobacteria bacterium]|jgi:glutamyl-tRNA reductase|nr:glutamyl-tRNA reductase [Deltaproteobacteria bacterium]